MNYCFLEFIELAPSGAGRVTASHRFAKLQLAGSGLMGFRSDVLSKKMTQSPTVRRVGLGKAFIGVIGRTEATAYE